MSELLSEIRAENSHFSRMFSIRFGENLSTYSRPVVMGIVNLTPDSFFSGSRFSGSDAVLQQVELMLRDGADWIDLGGYSTRPGASDVSLEDEITRTAPVIAALRKEFPQLPISIDTFRGAVAKAAWENGASMLNDISAGSLDHTLFKVLADWKCPYILMHSRGTPQTMNQLTTYDNLFMDIARFFSEKIAEVQALGVNDIMLDPGFGFAKSIEQNFDLLRNLDRFQFLGKPILAGLSRKSMIWKSLSITPEEALNGTSVVNTIALMKGAAVLRVHDVKEAKQLVDLIIS